MDATPTISAAERIDRVLELVRNLSRATDPQEVLRTYAEGIQGLTEPRAYMSLSVRGLAAGQFKITRFLDDMYEGLNRPIDPWKMWGELPVREGGLLGKIVTEGRPVLINDLNLPDDPGVGSQLAPYRSMMAGPLFDQGQPLNWAVLLRRDPGAFTDADLEETILRGNLVGGTVRHVLMAKQLREANERIRREVEHIARIQRGLLPDRLPQVPGLSMSAEMYTFDQAGGDLYDVTQFLSAQRGNGIAAPDAHDPWALLIADASGHGPAATTVGAMVHAILHTYPRRPKGPAEMLAHVNHHLCAKRIESSFVTALLVFFNPADFTLTYARAGHPPAILKNPGTDGEVVRLDEVGTFPLGVLEEADFEEATIELRHQQTLLMYTDGITESTSPAGEMFGVEGVERAARDCRGDPGCTVGTIFTALRKHEQGRRPQDDQTVLAMHVIQPLRRRR